MTLAEYLASLQAREDVKALLAKPQRAIAIELPTGDWLSLRSDGAWDLVVITTNYTHKTRAIAYYRPDGDRFVVADLGEGVKALRLRTGQLGVSQRRLSEVLNGIPTFGVICYGNTLCRTDVKSAMIPDAICRVMLASLRVAQS